MQNIRLVLRVEGPLPSDLGHIPLAPIIDFAEWMRRVGAEGFFDPNSLELINLATGQAVEYGRGEEFAHGGCGRIEWVVEDPQHLSYELRFRTAATRPALEPQRFVPMVGVGDLLRYNAGVARPIFLGGSLRLADITGRGRADLLGCWNYYHRPAAPISGVVCYPRTDGDFSFGDMVRLRYRDEDSGALKYFPGVYQCADFADLDGDGCVDIAFAERGSGAVSFYLQTGERDGGGWPVFCRDQAIEVPFASIEDVQLCDVDGDGVLDLVVNGHFIRNENPAGWPFVAAAPIDLEAGQRVAFLPVADGGEMFSLDIGAWRFARCLRWHRRMENGEFAQGVDLDVLAGTEHATQLRFVEDGARCGLLVQRNVYQEIVFYEYLGMRDGLPSFATGERAESVSALMAWSDQAWPCVVDWDGDGVQDLLVGGGYGWPRIARNLGSNTRPIWGEPQLIEADGAPIRVLRDEILSGAHWHNMGYPYPVFVDWDGDGLSDLLLPNETNRIVWYKNIGTRTEPRFGERQYIEVDGYADSQEVRAASGRAGADDTLANHPYPRDESSPFFWRTGAAFADWNGDGLMDFITHDLDRRAALFVQYRDAAGVLRVRREGPVCLEDGRVVEDAIVGREKHWTESFRAVDWDGNGLLDLLYNLAGTGAIYLLRNVGTKSAPLFAAPRRMCCYGEPLAFTIHGPNAWPADLNGDGKPDLLGCVEWSVYPFFAHAALEMERHPEWSIVGAELVG